ncbi:flagellar protein FlaG [Halalkalibacter alkaliphilus]|uniref:Flagellar protein FlaG n=1 Tax=Halalkalibacter alkaliphilus TaxID=2917993 RepID=A0A9X2CRQ1_9BACI|nr:flagellar protein FlaG [Halalkalibacter alkaliphilus]MCL7746700.1 flagellar protein FlaG [Halalkalibacter alkaliphilus]
MDVKGLSSGMQVLKENTQSAQIHRIEKADTPSRMIEKGVEEAKAQRQGPHSKEMLDKQVESMNELLESSMTAIKFNVHEDLNRLYVQVVNRNTDEVVKEVPPEQFLDMVASMLKHAGLIVDERI